MVIAAAVLVVLPLAVLAQIPPPALPGSPDQAPIGGAVTALLAGEIYGIWRLTRKVNINQEDEI